MKKAILMILSGIVLILSGCTTTKQPAKPKPLPEINAVDAKAAADAFMTQFLAAVKDKDCQKLNVNLLSEQVAKNMTPSSFARYCDGFSKHLGQIIRSTYMCDLSNPLYRSFVWKLTLERKLANQEAENIIVDVLFQVQVIRIDDKYKISNFIITR